MGVRGRGDRLEFAASFSEIYHFRLLYSGTTFMFPILGSLRRVAHSDDRCVLYQRQEKEGSEQYVPVGCWLGREPTPQEISELVPKQVEERESAKGDGEVKPAGGKPAVEKMPWD